MEKIKNKENIVLKVEEGENEKGGNWGEVYVFFSTFIVFFSSRRRHTRLQGDWSSDVCSSDLRKYGS